MSRNTRKKVPGTSLSRCHQIVEQTSRLMLYSMLRVKRFHFGTQVEVFYFGNS